MHRERWLLPEGIDELLPDQARALERLRRRLLDLYAGWGYELVITPFIEYLESLLTGTGRDLELETFKLIDQMNGRQLGLRADITPQAARIDAHQLRRESPSRLCYIGSVLRTRPDGFAGSRSPLQIGAELYGHAGVESDAEILRLMMETLGLAGVCEIYLDLGHVGIYRGLATAAGLSEEQERELFAALQRKAVAEIGELLSGFGLTPETAGMFLALAELNGGPEVLPAARERLAGAPADVLEAVGYLQALSTAVERQLPGVPVHYDLAELRGYGFHSGAVFAAFVPGLGQEIARGGRYDQIGEVFGRARPATGFSADLKTLMRMGEVPPEPRRDAVLAPWSESATLAARIAELRAHGRVVIRDLPGAPADPRELGCSHRLERLDGAWVLNPL